MPMNLQGEILAATILGLLSGLLLVLLFLRRQMRRRRQGVVLVVVVALFVGLSFHAAWRLEHYCNQSYPHVDCVSDRYDGVLWAIFRPMRRLYRGARHLLAQ